MDNRLNFKKMYMALLFGFSLLLMTIAFSKPANAYVVRTPGATVYVPSTGYGYRYGHNNVNRAKYYHRKGANRYYRNVGGSRYYHRNVGGRHYYHR